MTTDIKTLKVKLFADGADLAGMKEMAANPMIKGFTTNPTLMRKCGIADYEAFAQEALGAAAGLPISFEVFADEPQEMERQARKIATWGKAVYVKIPITNTQGVSCVPLIGTLASSGVRVNVTAVMTLEQVESVTEVLHPETPAIVSVFAGRIADTGRDPVPLMREAASILAERPMAELLWASPRELLNVFQADECGCDIITVTSEILKKLAMVGKPLEELSLETVKMFYNDAAAAGYTL
jgi:transaldolase